jgi:hypothetical protein
VARLSCARDEQVGWGLSQKGKKRRKKKNQKEEKIKGTRGSLELCTG